MTGKAVRRAAYYGRMSTPAGEPDYLADGVHLYEVLKRTPNHGLLGGEFVTVVNCQTDERRVLEPCEAALCETVRVRHAWRMVRRAWRTMGGGVPDAG